MVMIDLITGYILLKLYFHVLICFKCTQIIKKQELWNFYKTIYTKILKIIIALIIVTVKKWIIGYLTNMKTFHNRLTGMI